MITIIDETWSDICGEGNVIGKRDSHIEKKCSQINFRHVSRDMSFLIPGRWAPKNK